MVNTMCAHVRDGLTLAVRVRVRVCASIAVLSCHRADQVSEEVPGLRGEYTHAHTYTYTHTHTRTHSHMAFISPAAHNGSSSVSNAAHADKPQSTGHKPMGSYSHVAQQLMSMVPAKLYQHLASW